MPEYVTEVVLWNPFHDCRRHVTLDDFKLLETDLSRERGIFARGQSMQERWNIGLYFGQKPLYEKMLCGKANCYGAEFTCTSKKIGLSR
jgi:hypothetical protein